MIKRILLSPFSLLYGAVTKTRTSLYKNKLFKSVDLQVKTISIGNITVGGTGKTPLVAFTAKALAEKGKKVCILTRGYGRENPKARVLVSDGTRIFADAREAGDEPFELANKLLGVSCVVADADRASAGNWVRRELGITAFVLDDAFQHLKVKRDLDLVCIDASNPFGNGKLLPQGILREPLQNLQRANAVVITRSNLVDTESLAKLKSQLHALNPHCKIFVSANKIIELVKLKDFYARMPGSPPVRQAKEQIPKSKNKFLAFCALGNPENFFEQLRRENFDLKSVVKFSDHHIYTSRDVKNIERQAVTQGAEILLTTAKDAVKLSHLRFNFPCLVVESGLIFDDESAFKSLIQES